MDPITIGLGLLQLAPMLVKWFDGDEKDVAIANKAIDNAKVVTGRDSGEAALESLKADPALVLQFRIKVLDSETEFSRMYLADRQDARKRDTSFVQAGRYNVRADILAFLAVAGLISCVYFITKETNLPERTVNAIMFIAGVLASAVRDVYGFEFGSSKGSKEAQVTIAEILKEKR